MANHVREKTLFHHMFQMQRMFLDYISVYKVIVEVDIISKESFFIFLLHHLFLVNTFLTAIFDFNLMDNVSIEMFLPESCNVLIEFLVLVSSERDSTTQKHSKLFHVRTKRDL